ncbi:uncharacterized protein K444DRAFT_608193 [Hyaloscypha bicolor E]|uniref:Hydrophobin n=1 Tax=Hyaloscypha bicolor E TaxID=1095630 RepID=A0A2J6TRH3_9HELO|nr:uncharacterized protein K444DRAFT_608193 [Hyaloscypha bicolor E]PMD65620.1 hypothetical protein K444DRAFT_608193 [Hyaloscypha bicolor E]
MRFSTTSLMPLLPLLTTTTTAFSCNSTFPLTVCCGAYIPYETGSATDLAIFCGPAPLNSTIDMATNITSTEAYCPAAASVTDQRYPGCCQRYESREEMAFNCLPQ